MRSFFEAFRSDNNKSLINAAKEGNADLVKKLLADGNVNGKVNIDFQDKHGATALMYASLNGYDNVVEQLLVKKANVDLVDKDGRTAFMMASMVDSKVASQHGHDEVVEKLLGAKANVDLADKDGRTAFMFASGNGRSDVVKKLLEN